MSDVVIVINNNATSSNLTAGDGETLQINPGASPVDSKFVHNLPYGVEAQISKVQTSKDTPVNAEVPVRIVEAPVEVAATVSPVAPPELDVEPDQTDSGLTPYKSKGSKNKR